MGASARRDGDAPATARAARSLPGVAPEAGSTARDARVRASYDAVAPAYADSPLRRAARQQPFESWLLYRVAAHAAGGPVVEVGAAPAT